MKLVPVVIGTVLGTLSLIITLQIISAGGAGKNGSTVAVSHETSRYEVFVL